MDDEKETTMTGVLVIEKTKDLPELNCHYSNIIVAIDSPDVRLSLLGKIEEEKSFWIDTLVSLNAYVSSSAQIMPGCIIEPMTVIQSMSIISKGCIISAGAVVNHASMCCDGVHVDCNATVAGTTLVTVGMKIKSVEVYNRKTVDANDFFFNSEEWVKRMKK